MFTSKIKCRVSGIFNFNTMRNIITLLLILVFSSKLFAIEISADLFTCDEAKIEKQFEELNKLEAFLKSNPEFLNSEKPMDIDSLMKNANLKLNSFYNSTEISSPGKLPSFWFAFTLSIVGTYSIYGVAAGPIAVLIVHYSSGKDKTERKKAIWGCVTGTLIGAGIKYAVYKLG